MEGFQKIVLIIAIIILTITLVIMVFALEKTDKAPWPPVITKCPDWWIADGSGNNSTCINIKDLGVCSAREGEKHQTMNFNTSPYTGEQGTCAKYTWANNCKVTWDGITYGAKNPCSS